MGRAEKRELVSRLTILLVHLLKWTYQPNLRGRSWRLTIKEQRKKVLNHLADNPSLRSKTGEAMAAAYDLAILRAARQTAMDEGDFPAACPWTFEEAIAESGRSRLAGACLRAHAKATPDTRDLIRVSSIRCRNSGFMAWSVEEIVPIGSRRGGYRRAECAVEKNLIVQLQAGAVHSLSASRRAMGEGQGEVSRLVSRLGILTGFTQTTAIPAAPVTSSLDTNFTN